MAGAVQPFRTLVAWGRDVRFAQILSVVQKVLLNGIKLKSCHNAHDFYVTFSGREFVWGIL